MPLCTYSCIELWRPEDPGMRLVLTLLELATEAFAMAAEAPRLELMLCYVVGYTAVPCFIRRGSSAPCTNCEWKLDCASAVPGPVRLVLPLPFW